MYYLWVMFHMVMIALDNFALLSFGQDFCIRNHHNHLHIVQALEVIPLIPTMNRLECLLFQLEGCMMETSCWLGGPRAGVTRFGEIFNCFFRIWGNFEPALTKNNFLLGKIYLLYVAKIKTKSSHLVTLIGGPITATRVGI